ncbi:hypothetical protein LJB77_01375 [Ruminococcaceae bacterium OttesenSCG-928-N02]|nr:hypothetical protein [Ruminococcaceae bacterium OttesenSCG-928-N02]
MILLLLCTLCLSGCAFGGKEIGETPLIRLIVITQQENYKVQLVVYNAADGTDELLEGRADTIPAAYLNATSRFSELPYMGHLQAVYIDEDLCRNDSAREIAGYLAEIAGVRIKAAYFVLENGFSLEADEVEAFMIASSYYIDKLQVPPGNLLTPYTRVGNGNYNLPLLNFNGLELTKTACMVCDANNFLFKVNEYLQELDILSQRTHTAFYNAQLSGHDVSFQLSDIQLYYTAVRGENGYVIHVQVNASIEQLMASETTLQVEDQVLRSKLSKFLQAKLALAIEKIYVENNCDLFGFAFLCAQIPGNEGTVIEHEEISCKVHVNLR